MDNIIDFYDIYDYYSIPFWQTTWFKICAPLLGIAIIGTVLFFVFRKKKKLLPWEWANQQVQKLSSMTLVDKNDYKKFYFALTAIIKGYLAKRYAWNLDDKTDEELLIWLKEHNFNPEITAMLQTFADGALWIKFANAQALKSQAETDLKTVLTMIEKTTQASHKAQFILSKVEGPGTAEHKL